MNGDTTWQKATKSAAQGDCVEMRRRNGGIEVRGSKNPHSTVLAFAPTELRAWLAGAKDGEFDDLV